MLAFSGFLHPFCTFPFKFEFLSKYFHAAIISILFVMLLSLTVVNVSVYRQCVCCFFLSFDSPFIFICTFSHKYLATEFTVAFLQAYFQQNFRLKTGFYCAKWMWSLLKLWGEKPMKCVECTIIWIWNTNDL